ncbi:MAG: hypothetical protein ABSB83_00670 [Methanomassiliicoccales archaeon]|jgi:hypothetical protein
MPELTEEGRGRKSFALVVRGYPDDFSWLIEQAKIVGLYIVFSKSSTQRLIVEEVSW